MSTLFSTKRKRVKKNLSSTTTTANETDATQESSILSASTKIVENPTQTLELESSTSSSSNTQTPKSNKIYYSFQELGLSKPLQTACTNLGFKRPTPIQQQIIPAILHNSKSNAKNPILALSPTGSGKTASYALPILEKLQSDPYGIFALIITPTRELAKQVFEQILALGSLYKVKCCLVVGGCDIVQQSCELARHPHICIATPGRFAYLLRQDHINNTIPMKNLQFLVLDEADQLLTSHSGFERDVATIVSHATNNKKSSCQTLLFSATMTVSLERLNQIANNGTSDGQFLPLTKIVVQEHKQADEDDEDSNIVSKLPAGLVQEYIFMPSHVRDTYVVATIQAFVENAGKTKAEVVDQSKRRNNKRQRGRNHEQDYKALLKSKDENEDETPKARSVILFCSSCERTAHLSALLTQLHISNLPLHSLLSQQQRFASLHRFKSRQVPILLATDVASRGLDIPTVDLVLNVELPLKPIDYIHRVGRTARAGRRGRAISFISEVDVSLLHSIETITNIPLKECKDVKEQDAVALLNIVSKASRMAKMKLLDMGFDDLVKRTKDRKKGEKKAREQIRGFVRKQLLEKEG